jgi:hypothetical protein
MKKVGKKLGVAASEKVGALAMLVRGKSRDSRTEGVLRCLLRLAQFCAVSLKQNASREDASAEARSN